MNPTEARDEKEAKDGPVGAARGAAEVSVGDLESKGFDKVKVLREKDLDGMIRQAVGVALAEDARDRNRLLARARERIAEHAAEAEARRAFVERAEAEIAERGRVGAGLEAELCELEEKLPPVEDLVLRRRPANAERDERNRPLRERLGRAEAELRDLTAENEELASRHAELGGRLAAAKELVAREGEDAVLARIDEAERRARVAARSVASLEKKLARARAAAASRRPKDLELGKGLDIGTANLVSGLSEKDGSVYVALQRNAFIEVEMDALTCSMLDTQGVPYARMSGRAFVVGDPAFELASVLNRETRRPMARGILSPKEKDALPIMRLLIERLLGPPQKQGEICCFSVPAEPVDSDANAVYHEKLFQDLLARLGYDARPVREGHAVVLAELADDDFTGIGVSCGGGMHNVCVAYKSVPVFSFSTARGGDWVDQNVAEVLGVSRARATAIKEAGVDLREPKDRGQQAVAIYYRALIQYTLGLVKNRFEATADRPEFPGPIDIVFAGGTALAGGFIDLVREELSKLEFPLPVKQVRLASDPLHAVAKGCVVAAMDAT